MIKAEERAHQAFPDTMIGLSPNLVMAHRDAYKRGYKQAVKDFTWEDMKAIVDIADSMLVPGTKDCIDNWGSEEAYYQEVLKRFNEKREK